MLYAGGIRVGLSVQNETVRERQFCAQDAARI
jgi:hypothetical protein